MAALLNFKVAESQGLIENYIAGIGSQGCEYLFAYHSAFYTPLCCLFAFRCLVVPLLPSCTLHLRTFPLGQPTMPPASLTRVRKEVIQIAQIRVFEHNILVKILMHEYFLETPVHKQSWYDFKEFTWPQFARLPGAEAALKKLDPGVIRILETWSSAVEMSRKYKGRGFDMAVLFCAVEPMDLAFWGFRLARQFRGAVGDNGENGLVRDSRL